MNALEKQHGGNHYKNRAIQPVELWAALDLNGFQSSIVKYITRHEDKNGAEDIDKAEHFFDLMVELGQAPTQESEDTGAVQEYCDANDISLNGRIALLTGLAGHATLFKIHLNALRLENGYPIGEQHD